MSRGSTAQVSGDGQSLPGSAHGPLQGGPESSNYFCPDLVNNPPRTLSCSVPGSSELWPSPPSFTPKCLQALDPLLLMQLRRDTAHKVG